MKCRGSLSIVINHPISKKECENMKIKVIIHDGIVTDVLSDGQASVEIVDIDKDYADCTDLLNYEQQLYMDKELKSIDFTTAHFGEESE